MRVEGSRPRICLWLIGLLSSVVRPTQRERWVGEWSAEVIYWWETLGRTARRGPSGVARQCYRAGLAGLDAVHVRRLRAPMPTGEGASRTVDRGQGASGEMVRELMQDARYALRSLRRQPGFAAVSASTMGLGIAVTTVMFSLVHGVLLSALPYPNADQVVSVWPERWFSPAFFDYVVEQTSSYDALAGWQWRAHIDVGGDRAVRIFGPMATAGFFDVLDPGAAIGRTFADGEDTPGNDGVVVLSHEYWQRRFGGDRNVVGQGISLRAIDRTIIGVMPPGFDFLTAGTDVVLPTVRDPESVRYQDSSFKLIGRLRDGTTVEQATAEIQAVVARIREDNELPPEWGSEAAVHSLRDTRVGDVRPMILLLFGAVALLLLIATANVANLMLVRALSRTREFSLRLALGARRGRVIRQLLTESSVLGLIGTVPGVLGAALGLQAVLRILPSDTPRLSEVHLSVPVLGFSVAVALVTGWLVGLAPAIRVGRSDLRRGLTVAGRGAHARNRSGLRSVIAGTEVALAVMLLAGSGVLIKSFSHLARVEPGFSPDGLLRFELIAAPGSLASLAEAEVYFDRFSVRVAAIPGVESVSRTTRTPFSPDGNVVRARVEDQARTPDEDPPLVRWLRADAAYFGTAEIPLLAGRGLRAADDEGSEHVAVISESLSARLFPGEPSLGRSISTGFEEFPVRVVGVVADLKTLGLDQTAPMIVYRPYRQTSAMTERFGVGTDRAFLVRTSVPPESLIAEVSDVVQSIDRSTVLQGLMPMQQALSESLAGHRVVLILLSTFAMTALALGSVGIFGVMSFGVQQRRKELGIRVALGATRGEVYSTVLREGLQLAGIGGAAGILLSMMTSRVLEAFVFEISPVDVGVLAAAMGGALIVATAASLLPARRAGRADPLVALSSE